MLGDALLFQLGYNANLVTLGATCLGVAAGIAGTFLFLRKRALISDAIAHATLPGICLAFLVMVSFGGDGRMLFGLMAGAALSAAIGLICVQWLSQNTRLGEDTAIGAVLSVFFGFGVVLLTLIQSVNRGQQAGLKDLLLGSTAGMLFNDAIVVAVSAAIVLCLTLLLRRPINLATFDPNYARVTGWSPERIDLAMLAIVLLVTVVGLKIVGLVLIIALLIIPPVSARFWSDRSDHVLMTSGILGGLAGYLGAAISATAPSLPTGPIIVLVCFGMFCISLLLAPKRGLLGAALRYTRYQRQVHIRQGLLALAHGQPIYERRTLRLLHQKGLARADGVATPDGHAAAAKARLDEARWSLVRTDPKFSAAAACYNGLTPIEDVLTHDQIRGLDERLINPQAV